MPLILIKTTKDSKDDFKIAKEITDLTMKTLGVTESDVAIKFENSNLCYIDLYLYDKKQRSSQKDRTEKVFENLRKEIKKCVEKISETNFSIELHIILKERCFRAKKPRF